MILSLDLSTKSSGFAIFDNDKLIHYGCIQCQKPNTVERIIYISNEIKKITQTYNITQIYVEDVIPKADAYDDNSRHHANPNVFKPLMWLQAQVVLLAHENKIPIAFILPNSWRAQLGIKTGRSVKREELKKRDCEYVKKTFNIDTNNDDICDAIALGWSQIDSGYNWE